MKAIGFMFSRAYNTTIEIMRYMSIIGQKNGNGKAQKVLTTNHTKLRSYFRKWDKQILEWNTFCQNSSHSNLEIATNYVLNNKYVDKIVVGFQDKNELKEFLSIKNNLNKNDINFKSKYNLKNLSLLKPFLWK